MVQWWVMGYAVYPFMIEPVLAVHYIERDQYELTPRSR